ncbi:bluetail domain-containing putative surface protein [Methylocystis echinoides]|uniref:Uncharacterized protein n=1 Tax=Methylocystis echinoides TaxID=29468 RepID=A0A9W6GW50_9HYPH|nr:bluetail domain-containing putative surface protein [Methylocystis echinoides]GLI94038.1 hypothetical protein LMG27198_30300 [Methylocystis echinoides]
MVDYIAQPGVQNLTGTSGDDKFVFNYDQVDSSGAPSPQHDIDLGDIINGGAGYDSLWAGNTMDTGYSENFDFRPVTFVSIEELNFNWMKMPMPGSVKFNSSQFGTGLSNNLVVKGAWDVNDITVILDTANFDASGWTFPTPSTTTIGGVPAGGSFYAWGPYIYQGSGAYNGTEVGAFGGADTIHLVGSSVANNIVGSIVADIITGGDGDDTIKGLGGRDSLDGGIGTDTAVFTGNRSDYTVTQVGAIFTVVDNRAGSPDGTDTVTNVENFQFANIILSAADVVAGAPSDTTPPSAPAISSWNNTTSPIISGTNPLWKLSGTAEAGAIIRLYSTTVNADGTIGARTALSTYTQDPADATKVIAGVDYVVADASGNWSFQTNQTEHGNRRVSATATDAAGNVSAYSLVDQQGGHHSTTVAFTNPGAFAAFSRIDGYHQDTAAGDILSFTDADVTVTDADFAKVTDFEGLQFTGTATVTLGANALAAGIGGETIPGSLGKITTGAGNTTITDSNDHVLTVDGAALGAGTTLQLSGAADFVATGSNAGTSFVGGAGDDTFTGAGGDDSIDGGAGNDTAVFSGALADYTITDTGAGYRVVDNRAGSADGVDTVVNVENFQFSDQTVAASTLEDVTLPSSPVISSWNNTTSPIISGTNPLWKLSGTAEAGAIIRLYSTTVNADGTIGARTALSTYTQDPADATKVIAGVDYVVADASGNWSFQTNQTEHGNRRVSATATDAAGNVSAYSLVDQQGGHHSTTVAFTNPGAFAAFSRIDGYHQDTAAGDILSFTDADVTVTDADFAKVTDFEGLQFTGTATVTLGANALAAGIGGETIPGSLGKITTGAGNTTITDSNDHVLTVDGAALGAGTTLQLSGAADFVATGSNAGVKINAANTTGVNTLTGGTGADTLWGGSGANTIHGGESSDAIWLAFGAAGGTVASAALYGDAGDDNFYVTRQSYLSSNVTIDGGEGSDVLWAGKGMSNYEENFDFSGVNFASIEGLSFNYMPMEMPGQAIFSSAQFGSGLSNNLVVKGAWGDNDITVNLVGGDSSFDASGWTFPTGTGVGMGAYAWGSFISPVTNSFVTTGQEVGGNDTIHLVGSGGANTIFGTVVSDIISGGGGADLLRGGGGDDSLDGGADADTAVFSGALADYTITDTGAGFQIVDNRAGSADGVDTVVNVENFQFSDQTVAASIFEAQIPTSPVISSWNNTTSPIISGTNPLWKLSGTAEAGAIIRLYSTTVNADGTIGARTALSTYTQDPADATKVIAGVDYVVADASGNWSFQTNQTEHGNRRVSATATDAAGNVSAYSLVDQQGGHHSTTVAFTNPGAFAAFSRIDGYHQDTAAGDILSFTDADVTVTDADFAKVTDFEGLQFTGTATVTLGANALAAGIGGETIPGSLGKITTGAGNTTITDSNDHVLTVDGAALGAGTTLQLSGAADFVATGSNAGTSFVGGAGDDTFTGAGGDDSIDGGAGNDTAVFSGALADYTITDTGAGYRVVDNRAGSADGVDTVVNVENFQFSDQTVAASTLEDVTLPSSPVISSWNNTTSPIISGTNPLWKLSGTAEAGAIIRLYSTTVNADGTIGARTALSTYTQDPADATKVIAGVDYVVADASGNWSFQTNQTEHGNRRVSATATDAAGNVSAYSLVDQQGGHHSTTVAFTNPGAFAAFSRIDGYHQDTAAGDILSFTDADVTVTDADFAKVTDFEGLQFTGTATVTLGANALAAGIGGETIPGSLGKITTGAGNTTITDSNDHVLTVDGAALGAGTTLQLSGAADFVATGSNAGTSFVGGAGDDTFTGAGGDDSIDGGAGNDTAVFSGALADYTITDTGAGYRVVDNRAGSADGVDTVVNVENFQFSDQTVAASTLEDVTLPSSPVISSWNNTTSPIISGTNPLWKLSGTAEAGAIIRLYSTTVNADGTIGARTALSTYTQDPADATKVIAGVDYVVADASGNWSFQTNQTEHGNRRVSATATDAAGNVSAYSLVDQQGGHHSTTVAFTNPGAFAAFSRIDGYHQDTAAGDILSFTDADVTVTDADFAKVTDFEGLQFTGTATVTLGANALAAGIGGETIPGSLGKITTGAGNTTITDSNDHVLTVDGAALGAGTTLQLSGAADFVATGSNAGVKINAANTTGVNTLTGGTGADTLWGGSGANTIHGGESSDAIWLAFGAAGGTVASAALYGDAGDDNFYVTRQSYLSSNVTIDGGEGSDVLWAGKGMSNYEENFDFSGVNFASIEGLSFNYMPMEMPGQAIFSSAQFGSGLSNNLVVKGAWGDNDITVNLVGGDSSFDASGWTFPTGTGVGMGAYAWGSFISPVTNSFVTTGQEVGGNDTIHLVGSGGANTIFGTVVSDIISGGGGADLLRGGGGDDSLDGGADADTAVFSGALADYTITDTGAGFQIVDNRAGSADGVDTVVNVENFQFSDQTVAAETFETTAPIDWTFTLAPSNFNGTASIPVGAVLGTIAAVSNSDSETYSYSFASNAEGAGATQTLNGLSIDAATGQITTIAALSASSSTWLIVQDGAGNKFAKQFVVNAGTNVANTIATPDGTTVVFGLGGNDQITGTAANDALSGGVGNDTLDGGLGADAMSGGTGNDTYIVDDANDVVIEAANAGTDVVRTSLNAHQLAANLENLVFTGAGGFAGTGNALANSITGGADADALDGAGGADTLIGLGGDDTYIVDLTTTGALQDTVTEAAGAGTDTIRLRGASTNQIPTTITLAANVETLDASATGASLLNFTGNALANTIMGNAAANVITGGGGSDNLYGDAGDDLFIIGAVADYAADEVIDGGAGVADQLRVTSTAASTLTLNSLLTGVESVVVGRGTGGAAVTTGATAINVDASAVTYGLTITGNNGANVLTGTAFADTLDGNGGADTLDGGLGADTMSGGRGNDTYIVDDADDVVIEAANAGTDVVRTSLNAHQLAANVENLVFTGAGGFAGTGNALANSITGGADADVLDGAEGADTLIGLGGDDTYIVDVTTAGALQDTVTEAADAGMDTIQLRGASTNIVARTITLAANVEALDASATGASLLNFAGNALANTIRGNAAANLITGGGGSDSLYGDAGDDVFIIGAVGDYAADEVIDGGAGVADQLRVTSTAASTLTLNSLLTGVESVVVGTGTRAAAVTTGTTAINVNASAVTNGLTITGNNGANILTGTAYADALNGNGGADTLDGGLGADLLTGGAGNDVFVYTDPSASMLAAYDSIADVQAGDRFNIGHTVAAADFQTLASVASNDLGQDLINLLSGISSGNLAANGATMVSLTGAGSAAGTYLVINDATAGFDAATDTVVRVQNGAQITASSFAA